MFLKNIYEIQKTVVDNYFDGTKNKSTGEACTFIFVYFGGGLEKDVSNEVRQK